MPKSPAGLGSFKTTLESSADIGAKEDDLVVIREDESVDSTDIVESVLKKDARYINGLRED